MKDLIEAFTCGAKRIRQEMDGINFVVEQPVSKEQNRKFSFVSIVDDKGIIKIVLEWDDGTFEQMNWTMFEETWVQTCTRQKMTNKSFFEKYGVSLDYMYGVLDSFQLKKEGTAEVEERESRLEFSSLLKKAEDNYKKMLDLIDNERNVALSKVAQASVEIRKRNGMYPSVPEPSFVLTKHQRGISEKSGIYFAWERSDEFDLIAYVGQSINFSSRVRVGHSKLKTGDWISLLEFPKEDLNYAEAFYIGVLRPYRNF